MFYFLSRDFFGFFWIYFQNKAKNDENQRNREEKAE